MLDKDKGMKPTLIQYAFVISGNGRMGSRDFLRREYCRRHLRSFEHQGDRRISVRQWSLAALL